MGLSIEQQISFSFSKLEENTEQLHEQISTSCIMKWKIKTVKK